MIKLINSVKNFIHIRIDGDIVNFHYNWIDKNSSILSQNNFCTKQEMTDNVKEHYNFRRFYSNEGESVVIDGQFTEQVLIQDHSNPLNENKTDRKIHLPMDTHAVSGSKVLWKNVMWLIVSTLKDVGDAYKSAQIQQCNYILPFQNNTSDILQEPCIVETNKITDGVDENKILTLPNDIRTVKIQYNDNTKKLCEDKRIFLDMIRDKPRVYSITNIDTVTGMDGEHGLWILTCKADGSYSDTNDDKDLRICNYILPSTPTPSPTPTTSGSSFVAHNNGNLYAPTDICSLREGGTPMPFTAVFKDANGNVLTGLTPTWTITNLNGITMDDIAVTYDLTNYPMRVYVQIARKVSLIGATLKVHLVDSGNTLGSYDVNYKVVSFS